MKRVLLWIILASIFMDAHAQTPTFITDSLDQYIRRGITAWGIPGLAVAVVKEGSIVYAKGFGTTRVNGNTPVNEQTMFMIGSNTKAFTGLSLAMLQEAGKIRLSDKVTKWMPEFRLKDSLASREVNIIDLLSHRIGFETFQGDFTYWTSNLSRQEVIRRMGRIDPVYSFRSKWGYCNAAFLTAGELVPRITGISWEAMVRDSILTPLNMNQTLMLSDEMMKSDHAASPHTLVDGTLKEIPVPDINNLAPAASMSSNVTDMSKWLIANLNNGLVDGKQIIPARAFQSIRRPASIRNVDPRNKQETHFYLYGLGFEISDRDGKLVYSHTGAVDGFLSSLLFIPEENLGIVVLTNTDQNNLFLDLTYEIRDAFLGLPYKGFSDKSLKEFREYRHEADSRIDSLRNLVKLNNESSLPLKAYAGTYTNEVYGTVNITIENKELVAHFSNHPGLTATLEHIRQDTFLCTYSNPTFGIVEIPFEISGNKVLGLTLRVADFVEFTPYSFRKSED